MAKHSVNLNNVDEREEIIKAASAADMKMNLRVKAEAAYGKKSWEDDWLPFYKWSPFVGAIGNLVSLLLGVAAICLVCISFTGNWFIGLVLGISVTIGLEVAKSLSIKYSTTHGLKGNHVSSVILGGAAIVSLILSAYLSVDSGLKTPYIRDYAAREAARSAPTHATPLPSATVYTEEISELKKTKNEIENARAKYAISNPTHSTDFIRAAEYAKINERIRTLEKEMLTNTAEAKQLMLQAATDTQLSSMATWYYLLIAISELFVAFGYAFPEYYLYRFRLLHAAAGNDVSTETIAIGSNAKKYEVVSQRPLVNNSQLSEEQISAAINQYLEQKNKDAPPSMRKNATLKPKIIGFARPEEAVYAVYTEKIGENAAVNGENMAISAESDDDTLLTCYRQSNAQIQSRKKRTTNNAKAAILFHEGRMQQIQDILSIRGQVITKCKNNAFAVVEKNAVSQV